MDQFGRILGVERRRQTTGARIVRHLQGRLVAGILVFLPIFVTYLIFSFFYDIIDQLLDPLIRLLDIPHVPGVDLADVIEVVVIILIIYIAGLLIGWAFTKLLINLLHDVIGRIPVIGAVYQTTRLGIDFLSDTQEHDYRGVVLIEFPRLGVMSVGLVTSNLGKLNGVEDHLSIYVPTTPVPSSGYLTIIPASKVISTDITVDEAMRMIISGGLLAGDIFSSRGVTDLDRWSDDNWLWGGSVEEPSAGGRVGRQQG